METSPGQGSMMTSLHSCTARWPLRSWGTGNRNEVSRRKQDIIDSTWAVPSQHTRGYGTSGPSNAISFGTSILTTSATCSASEQNMHCTNTVNTQDSKRYGQDITTTQQWMLWLHAVHMSPTHQALFVNTCSMYATITHLNWPNVSTRRFKTSNCMCEPRWLIIPSDPMFQEATFWATNWLHSCHVSCLDSHS